MFSNQESIIGVGRQSALNAEAVIALAVKTRTMDLSGEPNMKKIDAESGGTRDATKDQFFRGLVKSAGKMDLNARPNALGFFLLSAFGNVATTTLCPSAVYQHVFTPAATLEYLSIWERIGLSYEFMRYLDCVVNKLDINFAKDDIMKASAEMLACSEQAGKTFNPANSAYEETCLFPWAETVAKIDNVQYYPSEYGLSFGNAVEDDYSGLGVWGLLALWPKGREIKTTMTLRPEDSDLWREANYGDAANVSPSATLATKSLRIKASSSDHIGATNLPYSVEAYSAEAILEPFKMDRTGEDPLENKLTFTITKSGVLDSVSVTLVNSFASYAAT